MWNKRASATSTSNRGPSNSMSRDRRVSAKSMSRSRSMSRGWTRDWPWIWLRAFLQRPHRALTCSTFRELVTLWVKNHSASTFSSTTKGWAPPLPIAVPSLRWHSHPFGSWSRATKSVCPSPSRPEHYSAQLLVRWSISLVFYWKKIFSRKTAMM